MWSLSILTALKIKTPPAGHLPGQLKLGDWGKTLLLQIEFHCACLCEQTFCSYLGLNQSESPGSSTW